MTGKGNVNILVIIKFIKLIVHGILFLRYYRFDDAHFWRFSGIKVSSRLHSTQIAIGGVIRNEGA